jgi:hypothetical protein
VITPTVWVAPTSQGTGDGSTAANAKAITSIVGTLSPGAIVGVRADLGIYNVATISPVVSGTAGSPIKWVGVDSTGKRLQAVFTTGRWPYRKETHDPEEVIMVNTISSTNTGKNAFSIGVSYATFEDFFFQDVGICFNIQNTANPSNLIFTRCHGQNVQRFIEHTTTNGHTNTTVTDHRFFGFSKVLIRMRGTSSGCAVSNFYWDSQRQDNDNWASGFMLDQTSGSMTFTDGAILNCHNNQGTDYWNADGGSSEETNGPITLTRVSSQGHTDGGIDCKNQSTTLTDCTFGDNKRLIKLWGGSTTNGGRHYIIRPVWSSAPHRRGGTGGAVVLDVESGTTDRLGALNAPEIYWEDADLRGLAGTNAGTGILHVGQGIGIQKTGVTFKLVNCQHDSALLEFEAGASLSDVRLMIADVPKASIPTSAIVCTSPTISVSSGSTNLVTFTTDRDASYGGVLVRGISGTGAASFTLPDYPNKRWQQGVYPTAPLTNSSYSITLLVEDIIGTQTNVNVTVNTVAVADQRVFDVSFRGANNSQTATDSSPHTHSLTWGTNAKITTTIDALGRLHVPFTANGTGTGKVTSADSADWIITSSGAATVIVEGVRLDTAATGLTQFIFGQFYSSAVGQSWRIYVNATGQVCFDLYRTSSALSFTLTDPTARSNGVDFDVKVTRTFFSGASYRWDLWVNGSIVATATSSDSASDAAVSLAIGASSSSQNYMAGYITRTAIYLGTATGT